MSDMRSFIKVEHSRFTLILRKGMLPFHWIAESHVYPDKGYVTAVRERDGVQGLPEYTFFIVMFRCTACGLSFEGGCSRKPAPYELQYNIAAWNRICNGDKCFALTYKSLGGRR